MTSETGEWSALRPCRNGECPHGRPEVKAFSGFGFEVGMLCTGCQEDEAAAFAAAEFEARQGEAINSLLSGVREPTRSWTLDSFDDGNARRQQAKAAALVWAEYVLAGNPVDLYLHGSVGGGKTGLVWAVARWLAEEHGVRGSFVNWRELLERLRESYDDADRRPDLKHLRNVRLLVLDDLGAERPTEWALEQLAGLVDYRNGRLPTAYTSNFSVGELADRLGRDDLVVGERIVSRIVQGAVGVRLDAPDRRAPGRTV